MCDIGTCRSCRLDDRLTDRVMGTKRDYLGVVDLPTREENYANRGKGPGGTFLMQAVNNRRREGPPPKTAAEKKRAQVARRMAERTEGENGKPYAPNSPCHGSYSGYNEWFCRCDPCTSAYSIGRKERKARKEQNA